MTYTVQRLEMEGPHIIASSSARNAHADLWPAQNQAEQLARAHYKSQFDAGRACWQGTDADGRTFRYFAARV